MLDDTSDAPLTEFNLLEKKGSESNLHPLNTVEVVLKLEEVWTSASIPTAGDIHKSLQQQDFSGRPLLQDRQQVLIELEAQIRHAVLVIPKDLMGTELMKQP